MSALLCMGRVSPIKRHLIRDFWGALHKNEMFERVNSKYLDNDSVFVDMLSRWATLFMTCSSGNPTSASISWSLVTTVRRKNCIQPDTYLCQQCRVVPACTIFMLTKPCTNDAIERFEQYGIFNVCADNSGKVAKIQIFALFTFYFRTFPPDLCS